MIVIVLKDSMIMEKSFVLFVNLIVKLVLILLIFVLPVLLIQTDKEALVLAK